MGVQCSSVVDESGVFSIFLVDKKCWADASHLFHFLDDTPVEKKLYVGMSDVCPRVTLRW